MFPHCISDVIEFIWTKDEEMFQNSTKKSISPCKTHWLASSSQKNPILLSPYAPGFSFFLGICSQHKQETEVWCDPVDKPLLWLTVQSLYSSSMLRQVLFCCLQALTAYNTQVATWLILCPFEILTSVRMFHQSRWYNRLWLLCFFLELLNYGKFQAKVEYIQSRALSPSFNNYQLLVSLFSSIVSLIFPSLDKLKKKHPNISFHP